MYLTPSDQHWACDIEADNLLENATRIWCVCLENVLTGTTHSFVTAEDFARFQEENPEAIYIGHNFLTYDAPMLRKFWKAKISVKRIVDTYVLSQVYSPALPRPVGMPGKKQTHSLEAWGVRLRYPKDDFHDFSRYTPTMLKYCQKDVSLTKKMYLKLSERMRQNNFTEEGLRLEHLAWDIIQNKQKQNGFPFDYEKGHELYVTIRAREEELKAEIYHLWPPELVVVAEYRNAHKKNGTESAQYIRHREQFPRIVLNADDTYDAYDYVSFNLGSPSQRIQKLLDLGWTPVDFTKKTKNGGGGNPKIDEDSLLAFAETSGQKEVLALSKWIVFNSRANMVRTWLNAYNEKTGCLHGSLFIASTLRYRHRDPNGANVPAVRTKKDADGNEHILYGEAGTWTYECRDLFTCGDPEEWSLVGLDGTGIQNRCLIHALIETVGAEKVEGFKALGLSGDIHKHNIAVLGLVNKPAAKKFYYTLMMGGGGGRLAADQKQFGTHMTAKEGEAKRRMMIDSIPGFGELIKKLEGILLRTGRIPLCDGTPVLVSSPHMVIPYLLQGDESRIMKLAMIYLDFEVRKAGLEKHVLKVADIHDEFQYRVRNEYVQKFIDIALPCFIRAGEYFNYKIAIEGDAKVGKTWAQTH